MCFLRFWSQCFRVVSLAIAAFVDVVDDVFFSWVLLLLLLSKCNYLKTVIHAKSKSTNRFAMANILQLAHAHARTPNVYRIILILRSTFILCTLLFFFYWLYAICGSFDYSLIWPLFLFIMGEKHYWLIYTNSLTNYSFRRIFLLLFFRRSFNPYHSLFLLLSFPQAH